MFPTVPTIHLALHFVMFRARLGAKAPRPHGWNVETVENEMDGFGVLRVCMEDVRRECPQTRMVTW